MADKKQNGPIVIKVFKMCTGEAKWVIVSTVYNHRLRPFQNPMNIVLEQLRAKNGSLFAREKHIKLKSTNEIQHW